MSDNTLRGWLTTLAGIVTALVLYVGVTVAAAMLSDSPVVGAGAANTAIFVAGLIWLRRGQCRGDSGVPGRVHARNPALWVLSSTALVVCWLLGQSASAWLYSLVGSAGFDTHTATATRTPAMLMLLFVLILSPMGEEMLMRGVIYTRLRKHLPPLAAALLSAGAFSLLHLNLVQIVLTLPLGILLALVYEHTGRISSVILLHAAFNLLSVVVPAAVVVDLAPLTFVSFGTATLTVLLAWLYRVVSVSARAGALDARENSMSSSEGK